MFQMHLPPSIDGSGAMKLLNDLENAVDDPRHAAIVLAGADGIFCNGADFAVLASGKVERDTIIEAVDAFTRCLTILRRSPKPTIALVDGEARGGGLGLAAACDVVVATERSRFALPDLLWGLLPAVIYPSLRRRLSLQQCRLWVMTGDARTAAEACNAGLVDEVVPLSRLNSASLRWQRHLSRAMPEAIIRLRKFLDEDVTDPEAGARRGRELTSEALTHTQFQGALRRFAEEGQPPWETP